MRGFRSLLAAFSPTHNDSTKLNNLPTTLSLSSSYLWYVLLVNKKSTRGCICSQWHRLSPPIKGAPALLGGGRMGVTRKIKYEFTRLLTRRGAGWSLGVFYSRPYHLLPLPFHFLSHNFKPFDGGGTCPFIYTAACSSCSLSSTWYQLRPLYLLGIKVWVELHSVIPRLL